MEQFLAMLSVTDLGVGAGILALISALKNLVPALFTSKWGKRLLPLLPVVLGVAAAFCGFSSGETTSEKLRMGFLIGMSTAWAFKAGKTTILGKGVESK